MGLSDAEAAIIHDVRGFYRLELPRENRRTVQTSTWLVQGWRANCDIQIILRWEPDVRTWGARDVTFVPKRVTGITVYIRKAPDVLCPMSM